MVTVAVHYPYLSLALALVFEMSADLDEAVSLFNGVHARWTALLPGDRHQLYLHKIGLGAWASQHLRDPFNRLIDAVNGTFWVEPPSSSEV